MAAPAPHRFNPLEPLASDCIRESDIVFAGDLDSVRAERSGTFIYRRLYFHRIVWVKGGNGSDSVRASTPGGTVGNEHASVDPDVALDVGRRYVIGATIFTSEPYVTPNTCRWIVWTNPNDPDPHVIFAGQRVSEGRFLEMLRDSVDAIETEAR